LIYSSVTKSICFAVFKLSMHSSFSNDTTYVTVICHCSDANSETRSPDTSRFVQNVLTAAELEPWNPDPVHLCYILVLNMIQFPDRDPTGFCNSEPDPGRTGFRNNSSGSDMDIQTAFVTAAKWFNQSFFWYKPDWIKYLETSTGLGLDRITQ